MSEYFCDFCGEEIKEDEVAYIEKDADTTDFLMFHEKCYKELLSLARERGTIKFRDSSGDEVSLNYEYLYHGFEEVRE